MSTELGAACALAGAAVFSVHSVYVQHAGDLTDAREAPPGDATIRSQLRDADIITGLLVAFAGGVLATVTKRGEPLIIALGAYGITAVYYHRACEGTGVY